MREITVQSFLSLWCELSSFPIKQSFLNVCKEEIDLQYVPKEEKNK